MLYLYIELLCWAERQLLVKKYKYVKINISPSRTVTMEFRE